MYKELESRYNDKLSDSDIVETLNELITICLDGVAGYEMAAEAADRERSRVMFQAYAGQRRVFAEQLSAFVSQHGGKPARNEHIAGELHQAWLGLRAALSGGDYAILAECARGDSYAVAKYHEALDAELPEDIHETVQEQYSEISQAQAKMNDLATLAS